MNSKKIFSEKLANLRALSHSPGSFISEDENSGGKLRHCGFCLNLCGFPNTLCGKCKRRAYCSKECQIADWSAKGKGQRHVNWCCTGYEYGEEDIDWEVVKVPKKGLGIRAKQFLPAGYRIIVEPIFTNPHSHPGIRDLEPKGASSIEKFWLNSFQGVDATDGKCFIGLRSARLNHDCSPNAGSEYDETACVKIVFAQRDILPGEEISISYFDFADLNSKRPTAVMNPEKELESFRSTLYARFGIKCPDNCYCKNPDTKKLVLEGRKLDEKMLTMYKLGLSEEAMEVGEKLIEIDRLLNTSWSQRANFYENLFEIALGSTKTLPKAKRYLLSSLEIRRIILPFSEKSTIRLVEYLKHPEKHKDYLKTEKKFPV